LSFRGGRNPEHRRIGGKSEYFAPEERGNHRKHRWNADSDHHKLNRHVAHKAAIVRHLPASLWMEKHESNQPPNNYKQESLSSFLEGR
jgi:hypothetical protein